MSRKAGYKVYTDKCGRCGIAHHGYSVKVDSKGREYVVCGSTNKRMFILDKDGLITDARDTAFLTHWVRSNDTYLQRFRKLVESVQKKLKLNSSE